MEGKIGDWNYQPYSALDWSLLDADPHFKDHGGESPFELASRSARALREIRASHEQGAIAVVAHGATIAHGLAAILGLTPVTGSRFSIGHTGFMVLDWTRPIPRLVVESYSKHLDD